MIFDQKQIQHQKLNDTSKRILPGTSRLGLCVLFLFPAVLISSAHASPTGGDIVGGSGSISQSGVNTTINQSSQNMAISWQSYNLNANERVQYIQPNASSISLNNILSQNGSTIAGRIDANGQVILVNPNGIFFTPTSMVNVGGLIASGLMIQPNDFMNGNYIFNEVLGTDGAVINHGMINASTGGNVALIGRQVENDGVIVANLGSVTLAAGKQAVLTFDQAGLLGVRVSEAILQDELGVDPAVLNSGEINAAGGQVLLTASTSQDVFSQAVNTGSLNQPLSVVMHEDGSFTLGSGADLLNSGTVDTSTTSSDQTAGQIVLLGENVTNSGELLAKAENGNGGEIELHAQNTTLLIENSLTSALSESGGQGGIVKVFGDQIELLDQSFIAARDIELTVGSSDQVNLSDPNVPLLTTGISGLVSLVDLSGSPLISAFITNINNPVALISMTQPSDTMNRYHAFNEAQTRINQNLLSPVMNSRETEQLFSAAIHQDGSFILSSESIK